MPIKGSENEFRKVLISEGTEVATPDAGLQAFGIGTDGDPYLKDDAGAVRRVLTEDDLGHPVDAANVAIDTTGFDNASGDDVAEVLGELDAAITAAGGGGAPTDARYLVGVADGTLSNERVRADLFTNYHPDNYPTSGTAWTDEFDSGSLAGSWSWTGSAPTVDASSFAGLIHITAAKNVTNKLVRAYAPGASTAFAIAAKVTIGARNQDNAAWSWGIAVYDSADNVLWYIYLQTSGTAATVDNTRIFATSGTGGSIATGATTPVYLAITRDASNVYIGWWSLDGITWVRFGTSTVATTVAKVGFVIPTNDNNGNDRFATADFFRVFTSATTKIGA